MPDVRVLPPVRGGPIIVIDDRPRSVGVWEIHIEQGDFEDTLEILARGMFGRVERARTYDELAELFGSAAATSVREFAREAAGSSEDPDDPQGGAQASSR
jgi:hypothetical protein